MKRTLLHAEKTQDPTATRRLRSSLVAVALFAVAIVSGCNRDEPAPTPLPAAEAPTAQLLPTFTPTPAGNGIASTAAASPEPVQPISAPAEALPLPTPTPAPAGDAPVVQSAVPAAATPAEDPLATGRRLLRYGDYVAARTALNQVAAAADGDPARRAEALYDLGRAYLGEGLYGEALATFDQLDTLLAGSGDPGQFGQKEHFLRAEALMGMGRYTDAVAAYWQFLDAYPWMGEAVQPRIARAFAALNDTESAAAAYRRAADEAADRFVKVRHLESLAQVYQESGRYADANAAYEEILAVAENPGYRTQILYRAGQALAAGGDGPGAIERWRAATAESPEDYNAYLALVELVNRNVEFDLYQRGYIDLVAEAYVPAINAYQAYLDSVDPTDARVANALHELGQSHLGAGNYGEALAVLDRAILEHPDCDCFGQAWLDKGAAQAGLGDSAGARRTYRTFARDYPDHPLAPEALWQSGRRALDEGNQLEAAVDFLALADAFPASERAPQALYALGMGALNAELYPQAAEALDRLQRGYPDYRWDVVGYWLGRSQAAAGQADAAQTTWQALVDRAPDIYYGILANYALAGIPMTDAAMLNRISEVSGPFSRVPGDDGSQAFAEQWLAGWLEIPAEQAGVLPPEIAEDQNLAKGRLLLELDQRGDALVALERVYERNKETAGTLYPLSLTFAELGAYRLSILSAARLMQFSPAGLVENAPAFLQRLAYPRPFAELIEREARANGFDPMIYYSLIRQESLFEEGARSSAAAQGLAQIIPDTGQWIAGQLGHPEYTNDIIYRPVINLRFGAYYLDWARDYLDGNLLSALVGYNAGPGNSQAWRERAGADDTRFVEILTFAEPRAYVQYILSNLYHYARLYGS
ncbi:MAG: transglycosylase SLT domain-containing protein [Caldilinea sp.]|nr:transglycosylase SLT domain-containing protein [Caldilinea sp.]